MSSFGRLYFLIIYTSKELSLGFVSHLSLPLSIHLYRSHLFPLSGLSHRYTSSIYATKNTFMPLQSEKVKLADFKSQIFYFY